MNQDNKNVAKSDDSNQLITSHEEILVNENNSNSVCNLDESLSQNGILTATNGKAIVNNPFL